MSSSLTVVSYRVILPMSPTLEFTNPTKPFLRQMCSYQVVAESLKLSMFVIFIFIALNGQFKLAALQIPISSLPGLKAGQTKVPALECPLL